MQICFAVLTSVKYLEKHLRCLLRRARVVSLKLDSWKDWENTEHNIGNVFEKRLIEAHIAEHHTDPVTGEDLELDDLVELKSSRIQRPRPPTLTSIPALLSIFQNEWDAIALQTYELQKELAQTRQELSTALYQHDAASRVIARLLKERDEARDALSKITVSAAANGDAMQVDSQELPDELVTKINDLHAT
jgi:pre-mRNA-processing factor 19